MIRRFIEVAGSFPLKGNLAVNLGGFELPIEIRFALIELGDHAMPPTLVAERHRGGIGPGKPRLAAYSVTAPPRWPPSRQRILDPFLDHIQAMVPDPADHLRHDLLALVLDPWRRSHGPTRDRPWPSRSGGRLRNRLS
jgi:hypothetical protein